jgi:cell division protein FtsW (lipid II flippase)
MIPILLIAIGLILITAGVRGKAGEVGEILKDDFTRKPSFVAWLVAVWIVGLIASFKQTRQLGNSFYALLLVVLLLSNTGFFQEFKRQAID